MILTERTINIIDHESIMDSPVVLYRGDKNVELKLNIKSSRFKFRDDDSSNFIESAQASYGQLIIQTPNQNEPIFSEITATKKGYIIFVITAEMIDEIDEVGNYTFQVRLLDSNKRSRATIPPVVNGIEIREPITSEDSNVLNSAVVGLASAANEEVLDTFDFNGNYAKTNWKFGDKITAAKLNKAEDCIYQSYALGLNNSSKIRERATKQEVDVERKRIDSLTSLAEGSTTGDAELIDGRIGADGITYSNIGNAIRNQFNTTNSRIDLLNNPLISGNFTSGEHYFKVNLSKNTTFSYDIQPHSGGYTISLCNSNPFSHDDINIILNNVTKSKSGYYTTSKDYQYLLIWTNGEIDVKIKGIDNFANTNSVYNLSSEFISSSESYVEVNLKKGDLLKYSCEKYDTQTNYKYYITLCNSNPFSMDDFEYVVRDETESKNGYFIVSKDYKYLLLGSFNGNTHIDIKCNNHYAMVNDIKDNLDWDNVINSLPINKIFPNVVLFGDSITDTNVNGEWVKHIKEYAKFQSLTNYARGFCTWTFKEDSSYNITDTSNANIGNNVIWNQFNRMKNDIDLGNIDVPDCIIILGGTNDGLQAKPLGNIDATFNGEAQSTDVTTLTNLCDSIRYVCELIMNTYPRCQIILCTPLQTKQISSTRSMKNVRDTIKQCGDMLGCKVIDQWGESGVYQFNEYKNGVHLGDTVHLTYIGGQDVAKFLAREFNNKINTRYQFSPILKKYFRNKLLGTTTEGVWGDRIMIPDQVIPSGSKLKQFKCNAFTNGTAYLIAFTKEDTSFTPVYFRKVYFTTGENTFYLDYTTTSDIYFGWKTIDNGFVGMDLSTIGKDVTKINNQQYTTYWSLGKPSYTPTINNTISGFTNTVNPGITFDCLLGIE